jgi:hypothetical protein
MTALQLQGFSLKCCNHDILSRSTLRIQDALLVVLYGVPRNLLTFEHPGRYENKYEKYLGTFGLLAYHLELGSSYGALPTF